MLPDPNVTSAAPARDPGIVRHLVAATLVGAALRLWTLGHQSLWIDEVLTWYTVGTGEPLGVANVLENIHGALYGLLLHLWVGAAGDGEWAMRFPSAIFGIATIPAMAWAGGRWLGREAVVPAAWLAAGSPFLVWYSQEARNYSLSILCACLATGALLALRERASVASLARALGISAAGLLSNFTYVLLVPLHLKWFFTSRMPTVRRVFSLAIAAGLLLLAMLPWVPRLRSTLDWDRLRPGRDVEATETPLRGATTFHAAAVPFTLHAFAVGYSLGPSLRELRSADGVRALSRHVPELLAVMIVFGGLGVLGVRELARRRLLLDAFLWVGLPALVISYFAVQNFKVFHPRYLAFGAPAILLTFAAGFLSLRPRARLLCALGVAGLWAISLGQHVRSPAYAKEDYRSAIAVVRSHAVPGEQVLAVGADEPVFYYYRGPLPVEKFWLGFAADPARLATKLDEKLAGASGTWIVSSRPEDLDPAGNLARLLDARTDAGARWEFTGVRVWRLPATPPASPADAGTSPGRR